MLEYWLLQFVVFTEDKAINIQANYFVLLMLIMSLRKLLLLRIQEIIFTSQWLCYHFYNLRQVTDQDGIPTQVIHSLPTQVLQERHTLLTDDTKCGACLQGFQTYQRVRTLPCQHPFHVTCIDNWLTTHSQCPIDGSYVGSVTSAASVTDPQPREHLMPGGGHFTTGSNSIPVLGGAGKKSGQRLKGLSERNDSAQSLPSSFTLSGSGLLASQNNRKLRWVQENNSWGSEFWKEQSIYQNKPTITVSFLIVNREHTCTSKG